MFAELNQASSDTQVDAVEIDGNESSPKRDFAGHFTAGRRHGLLIVACQPPITRDQFDTMQSERYPHHTIVESEDGKIRGIVYEYHVFGYDELSSNRDFIEYMAEQASSIDYELKPNQVVDLRKHAANGTVN